MRVLDIDRILERIAKFDKTILATLTGGEVFLLPNFTDFVEKFTQKHYVRVDTNLSLEKRCLNFMNRIDPTRVSEISFSVHSREREKRGSKLQDLSKLARKFKDHGFTITGNYVAYPPDLKRMKEDIRIFQDSGVEILPSMYVGRLNGREYPVHNGSLAYTPEEMDQIMLYKNNANQVLEHTKGCTCHAGITAFFIDAYNNVYPCNTISKKLGNFWGEWKTFPKVIRCPEHFCGSPFYRRGFKSDKDTSVPERLLQSAVETRGVATAMQTYIMVANINKITRDLLVPVIDSFGLRGVVKAFRDSRRHPVNRK